MQEVNTKTGVARVKMDVVIESDSDVVQLKVWENAFVKLASGRCYQVTNCAPRVFMKIYLLLGYVTGLRLVLLE